LAAFLCVMVISPVWVRMLDRAGMVTFAHGLGIVGYVWMAIVFWYSALVVVVDLWNLLVRGASRWKPAAARGLIPPRLAWISIYVLVSGTAALSFQEAGRIAIREVLIRTPQLPAGANPIRIVQISDVHLGKPRGRGLLERVIEKVSALQPDIVVSTGDLVDSAYGNIHELAPLLAALRPPLGKFAVLGNHEYYAGERGSVRFHEEAGFVLLRADARAPWPGLCIAGLDDDAGNYTRQPCFDDEDLALALCGRDAFVLFLKHQPRVRTESVGRFDLQLSGHTHGGQIMPFGWIVRLAYPHLWGMHRFGSRSLLYISRGAGTWGPPMRFLAPPEITLIVLEPAVGEKSDETRYGK
jgi:uncharacterized protein